MWPRAFFFAAARARAVRREGALLLSFPMASSKWVHPGKRITLSAGDTRITCAGGGGTITNGCAMVDCGRCPAAAAAAGVATTVTLRVHEAGDKGFSLFFSPRPALDGRTDLRAAGMYGVDSDGVRCIVDGVKREFGPAAEMVDGSLVAITFGACGFAVSVNGGAKTVLAAEFPACDMYAGAFLGPGASISLVSVDSSEGVRAYSCFRQQMAQGRAHALRTRCAGPAAVVKHADAEIKGACASLPCVSGGWRGALCSKATQCVFGTHSCPLNAHAC